MRVLRIIFRRYKGATRRKLAAIAREQIHKTRKYRERLISCNTARAESVDGNSPGCRRVSGAIVSADHASEERPSNPGRALEIAGQLP